MLHFNVFQSSGLLKYSELEKFKSIRWRQKKTRNSVWSHNEMINFKKGQRAAFLPSSLSFFFPFKWVRPWCDRPVVQRRVIALASCPDGSDKASAWQLRIPPLSCRLGLWWSEERLSQSSRHLSLHSPAPLCPVCKSLPSQSLTPPLPHTHPNYATQGDYEHSANLRCQRGNVGIVIMFFF